ncbi:hypothetical protein [Notoacmeibacter ruber]|uniref:hypothetical protein n=1 Tax=Notoacmeibacter ruber TaxID=2670375 RepID=UPI0011C3DBED|nr:hypothetical protein [Notoacmeibacter ruber]
MRQMKSVLTSVNIDAQSIHFFRKVCLTAVESIIFAMQGALETKDSAFKLWKKRGWPFSCLDKMLALNAPHCALAQASRPLKRTARLSLSR